MILIRRLTVFAPLLLLAVKVSALPPAPAYQLNSRGGVKPASAESPRQVVRVEAPATAATAGASAAAAGRAYLGPPNGNGNATLTIPHAVDGDDVAARRDRDRQRDLRKVNVAHRPAVARNEKPTPQGPDAPPTDDTSAALPGGNNHPRATGGCPQQQKRDNVAKHDDDDDFAAMLASRAGAATKSTTKFRTTPNPRVSRDSVAAFLAASYEQHYGRKLSSTSGEGEGGGGAPIKVKESGGLKGPANGKKSVEEELQRSYEEHFRHAPGKGKGHRGVEV